MNHIRECAFVCIDYILTTVLLEGLHLKLLRPLASIAYYADKKAFGLSVSTHHMNCNKDEDSLKQWFSIFLMPRPFNTVPHIVMIFNHKIIFAVTSSF